MTIDLWHCSDARSFRVLWTLEELGLPYTLHLLPFPPRVLDREYLQVNRLGTVPTFREGATFMTESVAIVQYLVARHGRGDLAVPVDDQAYGDWLNWLHFGEATLTFPQTLALRYRTLEPGRCEAAADDYAMDRRPIASRGSGAREAGASMRGSVHGCRHLGGIRAPVGSTARAR